MGPDPSKESKDETCQTKICKPLFVTGEQPLTLRLPKLVPFNLFSVQSGSLPDRPIDPKRSRAKSLSTKLQDSTTANLDGQGVEHGIERVGEGEQSFEHV